MATAIPTLILSETIEYKIIVYEGLYGTIDREFAAPSIDTEGITVIGNNLISSDYAYGMYTGTRLIYVHSGIFSTITSSFYLLAPDTATHFVKAEDLGHDDENNLIAAVYWYDYDGGDTGYRVLFLDGISASIVSQLTLSANGVAYDPVKGNFIRTYDPGSVDKIYVHVGKTSTILTSYDNYWGDHQFRRVEGCEWDGACIWAADSYPSPSMVVRYAGNYSSTVTKTKYTPSGYNYLQGVAIKGAIIAPDILTGSAGYNTPTSVWLQGNLLDTGGEPSAVEVGFEYYKIGFPGTIYTTHTHTGSTGYYSRTITIMEGVGYYYRAYCISHFTVGDETVYGEWKVIGPPLTIRASLDSTKGKVRLYGEIIVGSGWKERGFEYYTTDPGNITTVNETGSFGLGEFYVLAPLYFIEDFTFRVYIAPTIGGVRSYGAWMKSLPTVITQAMSSINYNKADGNGNVTSIGASELTGRGFEVKHEYSGSYRDSWRFEIAGFEGELESEATEGAGGVITDFYWAGELIKTVIEIVGLALGAYIITVGEMEFGWPVMDDCLIDGKAYKCIAYASNEFGTAYGDEVDFSTWARTCLTSFAPVIAPGSIIKNEDIGCLPIGITASRRGFRYGTTEAADEFDVHENGSFTNGPYSTMLPDLLPDTTYYIYAYIVVNGITYEGSLETLTTDAEDTEDSDEYPTPHFSPSGQDYREIETKVFAEVLASQGIIDFSGGKKTLSLTNHLIQTNPDAKTIADGYLNRFKLAKTRMNVSYPTPLPFEREDTIDFSYGALLFKNDDEGITHFKEDGEGMSVLMDQITMIIKQINNVGLIKTQTSIEYVADLDLEHE